MNGLRTLVCALFVFAGALANAGEFPGKVIAVMDGDTLLVLRGGRPVKVRLAEVDAPEKAQPYGENSQKSLAELTLGKQVSVVSHTVDSYGRIVATIYAGGVNVNNTQVQRGLAWEYSRFHSNHELMSLQREAQQEKRGLWAEENAVEPTLWRKLHPSDFAVTLPVNAEEPEISRKQIPEKSAGQDCARKNCSEIGSCEEARRYLQACGQHSLDGDSDGKPCERLCAAARNK